MHSVYAQAVVGCPSWRLGLAAEIDGGWSHGRSIGSNMPLAVSQDACNARVLYPMSVPTPNQRWTVQLRTCV
jgi:hypothetical protein